MATVAGRCILILELNSFISNTMPQLMSVRHYSNIVTFQTTLLFIQIACVGLVVRHTIIDKYISGIIILYRQN